ncbi:MAG: hypothetical protein R6W89_08045 [Candidatus Hydrogenedentota bacterium]
MDIIHEGINLARGHVRQHLFVYSKLMLYVLTLLLLPVVGYTALHLVKIIITALVADPLSMAALLAFFWAGTVFLLWTHDDKVDRLLEHYLAFFEKLGEKRTGSLH